MRAYEAVIGLEVHAQLLTRSKAFCFAPVVDSQSTESSVGPVSAGLPGALPVLNRRAVELAIRAGLALQCQIRKKSVFARKNYFYPDLPKGYQISQFSEPLCVSGYLDLSGGRRIGIERIHMEEDAGKLTHHGGATWIQLNRAGTALIEIVTRPELRTPTEAGDYLRRLHEILVFSGVCDGNLEEGHFRCDANVSIRPVGETKLGTRVELKNINSFRFIEKAIEFEIARQIAVVDAGSRIVQETRGWDSGSNKTFSMRLKEEAEDYRYFPDPDLPPLMVDESWVRSIAASLPELPTQMRARFETQLALAPDLAARLVADLEAARYFEEVIRLAPQLSATLVANWVIGEVPALLHHYGKTWKELPVSSSALAELLNAVASSQINLKTAKKVLIQIWETGRSAAEILKAESLGQVESEDLLKTWVDQVMAAQPAAVEQYKAGRTQAMGFLVGQVMALSGGRAHPQRLVEILKLRLGA